MYIYRMFIYIYICMGRYHTDWICARIHLEDIGTLTTQIYPGYLRKLFITLTTA